MKPRRPRSPWLAGRPPLLLTLCAARRGPGRRGASRRRGVRGRPAPREGGPGLRLIAAPHEIEVRREATRRTALPLRRGRASPSRCAPACAARRRLRPRPAPRCCARRQGTSCACCGAAVSRWARRAASPAAARTRPSARSSWPPFYLAFPKSRTPSSAASSPTTLRDGSGSRSSARPAPVVNVTWELAAEYCNWLSAQEGLPRPTSLETEGRPPCPLTIGYRLPTEAEWSRAARYPAEGPLRFPWGPSLPPPVSRQLCGRTARSLVTVVLQGYEDRPSRDRPRRNLPPECPRLFQPGGTRRRCRQSSQIDEPDYGYLFESMMVADGAKVPHENYCAPRVEIELAFVLGGS